MPWRPSHTTVLAVPRSMPRFTGGPPRPGRPPSLGRTYCTDQGSRHGSAGNLEEEPMAEDATGWGGALWAAADLATPMAIRVAATLRLADSIAAGTRTPEALAAAARADPDALERVMAHLVTAGVLTRTDAGFGLTEVG